MGSHHVASPKTTRPPQKKKMGNTVSCSLLRSSVVPGLSGGDRVEHTDGAHAEGQVHHLTSGARETIVAVWRTSRAEHNGLRSSVDLSVEWDDGGCRGQLLMKNASYEEA